MYPIILATNVQAQTEANKSCALKGQWHDMCVRGSYLALVRSTSTDAGTGAVLDGGSLGTRPPRRQLEEPRIGPEVARTGSHSFSSSTSIACEGTSLVIDGDALVLPPGVPKSTRSHSDPSVAVAAPANQSGNPPWRAGLVPPPAMEALGSQAPVGRPARLGHRPWTR
jgi:hypothetical protein